jgi:hypothetical protein
MYKASGEVIIAACDKELLGKEFHGGSLKLDVQESFYKGKLVSCREISDALKNATIANLVGERVIKCAILAGYIDRKSIIKIGGIPHAQLFVLG